LPPDFVELLAALREDAAMARGDPRHS